MVIPSDDGLNAITIRVGLDDEPKQHVDYVYDPDSLQCQRG